MARLTKISTRQVLVRTARTQLRTIGAIFISFLQSPPEMASVVSPNVLIGKPNYLYVLTFSVLLLSKLSKFRPGSSPRHLQASSVANPVRNIVSTVSGRFRSPSTSVIEFAIRQRSSEYSMWLNNHSTALVVTSVISIWLARA